MTIGKGYKDDLFGFTTDLYSAATNRTDRWELHEYGIQIGIGSVVGGLLIGLVVIPYAMSGASM